MVELKTLPQSPFTYPAEGLGRPPPYPPPHAGENREGDGLGGNGLTIGFAAITWKVRAKRAPSDLSPPGGGEDAVGQRIGKCSRAHQQVRGELHNGLE